MPWWRWWRRECRELWRLFTTRVSSGKKEHFSGLRGRNKAMTVEDVAALLNVSPRHVYKLVQDGILPHFKVGSSVRFDPDKMADWLDKAGAEKEKR
jgi:excisionase family DNA binding protein